MRRLKSEDKVAYCLLSPAQRNVSDPLSWLLHDDFGFFGCKRKQFISLPKVIKAFQQKQTGGNELNCNRFFFL
jgi:hypothetical protein